MNPSLSRPLRIVEPDFHRVRPPAITCFSVGCCNGTKHKKKYCKLHLADDPYVAAIIAENKRLEKNKRARERAKEKRKQRQQ